MTKLLILLTFNLYAIDFDRPQMLIKKLKSYQRAKSLTCLNTPRESKLVQYRESFIATIDCEYKCIDESPKTIKVKTEFKPRELSLSAGDGSSSEAIYWRSLGITLNTYKKQICFDLANKNCSKIESFRSKSISSGNWKLDKDISCKTKAITYSPFDSRFKLDLPSKRVARFEDPTPFPFFSKEESSTNAISEFFKSKEEARSIIDSKDCKNNIEVNTCFGDCIWEDKKSKDGYVETLSTPNPFGEDSFKLCIDDYVKKIKHQSKNVRSFKCEKFIWEFLRTSELTGESCAAMRFNHNCDSLKL